MFSDNEPSQSSAHLSFSVINVKEDAFLMVRITHIPRKFLQRNNLHLLSSVCLCGLFRAEVIYCRTVCHALISRSSGWDVIFFAWWRRLKLDSGVTLLLVSGWVFFFFHLNKLWGWVPRDVFPREWGCGIQLACLLLGAAGDSTLGSSGRFEATCPIYGPGGSSNSRVYFTLFHFTLVRDEEGLLSALKFTLALLFLFSLRPPSIGDFSAIAFPLHTWLYISFEWLNVRGNAADEASFPRTGKSLIPPWLSCPGSIAPINSPTSPAFLVQVPPRPRMLLLCVCGRVFDK